MICSHRNSGNLVGGRDHVVGEMSDTIVEVGSTEVNLGVMTDICYLGDGCLFSGDVTEE